MPTKPVPWEITWERNTDHNGAKRAVAIGPIEPRHDHWSGWTIADEPDAHIVGAAPNLLAACKYAASHGADASVLPPGGKTTPSRIAFSMICAAITKAEPPTKGGE